jgi:hypothetical protein
MIPATRETGGRGETHNRHAMISEPVFVRHLDCKP